MYQSSMLGFTHSHSVGSAFVSGKQIQFSGLVAVVSEGSRKVLGLAELACHFLLLSLGRNLASACDESDAMAMR